MTHFFISQVNIIVLTFLETLRIEEIVRVFIELFLAGSVYFLLQQRRKETRKYRINETKILEYKQELEELLARQSQKVFKLSEDLWQIYNNSSDAITILHITKEAPFLKIFDMNKAARELYLHTREFIKNGTLTKEAVINRHYKPLIQEYFPVLLEGRSITIDNKINFIAGSSWKSTIIPLKDSSGKVQRLAVFSTNTTAEREKEHLSAILHTAIESWPFAFWVRDSEGNLILQNNVCKKSGIFYGQTLSELNLPEETLELHQHHANQALKGEEVNFEGELIIKGESRFVNKIINPVIVNGHSIGYTALLFDQTARKMAEKSLLESEQRFRLLSRLSRYIVFEYDSENQMFTWDGAIEELTGYTPEEYKEVGLEKWLDFIHPEDREQSLSMYNEFFRNYSSYCADAISEIKPFIARYRYRTRDKGYIWAEAQAFALRDQVNNNWKTLGILKDISEQFKADSLIKESEEKLRTIFNNSKDGMVLLDENLRIMDINQSAIDRLGYSVQELKKSDIRKFLNNGEEYIVTRILESFQSDIPVENFETEIVVKSGKTVPVEVSASKVSINNIKFILLVVRDVSERKKLERQLLNYVIKTEEKERLYFSQELHDGLGPLLSAAKLYIDLLAEDGPDIDYRTVIPDLKRLLEESNRSIKEISFKLSPHLLQNYGIIEAIKNYSDKIVKPGKLNISLSGQNIGRFHENLEMLVYRIICECINNTIKHAKACNINIDFQETEGFLLIRYTDDGIGFDVEKETKTRKGVGILNIRSRLKSINGSFALESSPGRGCRYSIKIPIYKR